MKKNIIMLLTFMVVSTVALPTFAENKIQPENSITPKKTTCGIGVSAPLKFYMGCYKNTTSMKETMEKDSISLIRFDFLKLFQIKIF